MTKLTQQDVVGICEEQELRLSLHMIIAFRNMVMHSTEVPYDDMDNNSFSNSELPAYCSSWETVRDTICHATEFLLTYLKKDTKFTRRQFLKEQEVLLNLEKEMTQDGLLDIYGLRINRFLNVEQLLQMSSFFKCQQRSRS